MRLTVLGKSPAWSDAGGACSGYLIEEGEERTLLDCGNGVFAKLRARVPYRSVGRVLISHLHADHFLDLVPFAYALTLGPGASSRSRPALLAPPGARETLRTVVAAWGDGELIESAFELTEYESGGELDLGPLRARLHPVPHSVLTHAVELIAPSGGRITFGSDGRASQELVAAARGADLLLAEATLPEPERAPLVERSHMSAGEAGEIARRAGAGRLVLTHCSDELDLDVARAAATEAFGGPVEMAAEGASWEV